MNAPWRMATPGLQRTIGAGRIAVDWRQGRTRLADLRQEGALRLRLPRVAAGCAPEAVLINTAGGLTGGDRFDLEVAVGADCELWVTTQACEKVYRSLEGEARQRTRLAVAAGGRAVWLPQPAILFDGSAYRRELSVDLDGDAECFALEATVLGRSAMGERVGLCQLAERWRLRRQGRLLWGSEFRLQDAEALSAPVALNGARAFATFLQASPGAAGDLSAWREWVADWHGEVAVSAVSDEVVVGLLLAADADHLMTDLQRLVQRRFQRLMPRVWTC